MAPERAARAGRRLFVMRQGGASAEHDDIVKAALAREAKKAARLVTEPIRAALGGKLPM